MFHLDHVGEYMATRMYTSTIALAREYRLNYYIIHPPKDIHTLTAEDAVSRHIVSRSCSYGYSEEAGIIHKPRLKHSYT